MHIIKKVNAILDVFKFSIPKLLNLNKKKKINATKNRKSMVIYHIESTLLGFFFGDNFLAMIKA